MKILVIGYTGFVGSAVAKAFSKDHDVFTAARSNKLSDRSYRVDLLDRKSISSVLEKIKPEVIINCAGVVENSSSAKANIEFTRNLLDEVLALGQKPKSIIICGSAAEYGVVDAANLPVKEDTPLNAANDYGLSKKAETQLALEYKHSHKLPIVVVRIFNPIGKGMHPKFLIPGIIRQIKEIENGDKGEIEVSRLDSERDYIDVSDVALAIKKLVEGKPKHSIYNVGSGVSTSNSMLIDEVLKNSKLKTKPKIVENFPEPESIYAIQADITRMRDEFNWRPKKSVSEVVKEAMS